MNEFVNPQHRGVNLPAGFKDLIDVLEGKKKRAPIQDLSGERSRGPARIARGGIADVENYVRGFLETKANSAMLGFLPSNGRVGFYLVRRKGVLIAPFVFAEDHADCEKIVREVFAGRGISPDLDNYPVPASLPAISEIVTEILRRAFGIPERGGLTFVIFEP